MNAWVRVIRAWGFLMQADSGLLATKPTREKQRTQSAEPKFRAGVANSVPSFKGSAAVRRSRTPDSKTRASAAFIPGQARQIRVVNGRVEVEKVRNVF